MVPAERGYSIYSYDETVVTYGRVYFGLWFQRESVIGGGEAWQQVCGGLNMLASGNGTISRCGLVVKSVSLWT